MAVRVAHSCRVLATVFHRRELFLARLRKEKIAHFGKVRRGKIPRPARVDACATQASDLAYALFRVCTSRGCTPIGARWELCVSALISTMSPPCGRRVMPPCPTRKTPSPIRSSAASLCERAGASGITAHLRADRRHMQDRDLERLRANIMTKLNLEMGNTPEIIDFALRLQPDEVCLVPEKRQEITTEGGLDLVRHERELRAHHQTPARGRNSRQSLHRSGSRSRSRWRRTSKRTWSNCTPARWPMLSPKRLSNRNSNALQAAAIRAANFGLQVNAGHGINYRNISLIHRIPASRRAEHRPLHRRAGDLRRDRDRGARNARPDAKLSADEHYRPRDRFGRLRRGSRIRSSVSAIAFSIGSSPRARSLIPSR